MATQLYLGDCLEVLPTIEADSIDAIICDPPYGLSFMGKGWDHGVPGVTFWKEALRVAKPGAMLLAFGGTRTYHRLTVAIEDAGWEIRDCLMWLYGSGFPKSHDIGKAIDKAAGAEREVIGKKKSPYTPTGRNTNCYGEYDIPTDEKGYLQYPITAPATDAARQWDGWGTALKPAWEPIIMARKPLIGTVADNVLAWGAGGINVDACRVNITDGATMARNNKPGANGWKNSSGGPNSAALNGEPQGRWPANLILDEAAAGGHEWARFFYCAKASKRDRDEGLEGMELREATKQFNEGMEGKMRSNGTVIKAAIQHRNHHPTVKPTQLMRYLCRLVTPPGGVILDPFMGSGSTGKAAMLEGFGFVGVEKEADYLEIARRRIAVAQPALEVI
jgi:DNA modification methylase